MRVVRSTVRQREGTCRILLPLNKFACTEGSKKFFDNFMLGITAFLSDIKYGLKANKGFIDDVHTMVFG